MYTHKNQAIINITKWYRLIDQMSNKLIIDKRILN